MKVWTQAIPTIYKTASNKYYKRIWNNYLALDFSQSWNMISLMSESLHVKATESKWWKTAINAASDLNN